MSWVQIPPGLLLMKRCGACGESKQLTDFHRKGAGWKSTCKLCQKLYHKKWYNQNARRQKELTAIWKQQNPDKVVQYRLNPYGTTPQQVACQEEKQAGVCAGCKNPE